MKYNRFNKERLNLFVLLLFRASSWLLQGHPFLYAKVPAIKAVLSHSLSSCLHKCCEKGKLKKQE